MKSLKKIKLAIISMIAITLFAGCTTIIDAGTYSMKLPKSDSEPLMAFVGIKDRVGSSTSVGALLGFTSNKSKNKVTIKGTELWRAQKDTKVKGIDDVGDVLAERNYAVNATGVYTGTIVDAVKDLFTPGASEHYEGYRGNYSNESLAEFETPYRYLTYVTAEDIEMTIKNSGFLFRKLQSTYKGKYTVTVFDKETNSVVKTEVVQIKDKTKWNGAYDPDYTNTDTFAQYYSSLILERVVQTYAEIAESL